MILSLKTPKMSVLLRGGSFFLTTTTDNNNHHNHDNFYSVLSKFFCISQLIVLPFAASSLITSPGLRNFYHHFQKFLIFLVHTINPTKKFSLISAKNNINQKNHLFLSKNVIYILRNALRNQKTNVSNYMHNEIRVNVTSIIFSFFYLFLYSKIPWLWRILEKQHTFLFNKNKNSYLFFSFSQLYQLHKTKITRFTRPTDEKNQNQTTPNSILKMFLMEQNNNNKNQNCNITVQKKFNQKNHQPLFRYWTDKANEFSEFIPYQCYKIVKYYKILS